MNIKNVVVIGSGTMGSGIAAQLCNADIPVTLLDLKTEISEKAKKRIFESKPPLLIDKSKIDNIKTGNTKENIDVIGRADWIIEAIIEKTNIKQDLYEKIIKVRKKDSIISSNTSTIPLKILSAKMSDGDKRDFCITHFFNPVRYMDLLEIVSENINDSKKINLLKNFCEENLGKGVILCKDTPGFIGNRVGVYAMQVAMTEAIKMKLNIEEADAIFGKPMGIPKTGVFGLYDLIGLDLMNDVLKSFLKELPSSDVFHDVAKELPLVKNLIESGYTGRKGKGGFYRINKKEGKKVLEAINLNNREYFPSKKIDLNIEEKVSLKDLVSRNDKYGKYAWSVISKIILYAASLIPSVTKDHNNIDEAMRLGFNWTKGPFEMLEELGVKFFVEKDNNLKINEFIKKLYQKKSNTFYGKRQIYTDLETLGKIKQIAKIKNDNKSAITYDYVSRVRRNITDSSGNVVNVRQAFVYAGPRLGVLDKWANTVFGITANARGSAGGSGITFQALNGIKVQGTRTILDGSNAIFLLTSNEAGRKMKTNFTIPAQIGDYSANTMDETYTTFDSDSVTMDVV